MKKIISVKPLENYILQIEFESKEIRFFDVKPNLKMKIFLKMFIPALAV
jgi:hypothetical protein